jgi:hypothetical protein
MGMKMHLHIPPINTSTIDEDATNIEKHLQQEHGKVTHKTVKEKLTERSRVISHKMEPKGVNHMARSEGCGGRGSPWFLGHELLGTPYLQETILEFSYRMTLSITILIS